MLESTLSFILRQVVGLWPPSCCRKRVLCEGGADIFEVEKIDIEFLLLQSKKAYHLQVQSVVERLEALD